MELWRRSRLRSQFPIICSIFRSQWNIWILQVSVTSTPATREFIAIKWNSCKTGISRACVINLVCYARWRPYLHFKCACCSEHVITLYYAELESTRTRIPGAEAPPAIHTEVAEYCLKSSQLQFCIKSPGGHNLSSTGEVSPLQIKQRIRKLPQLKKLKNFIMIDGIGIIPCFY